MPKNLLNTLNPGEVLDLLAYRPLARQSARSDVQASDEPRGARVDSLRCRQGALAHGLAARSRSDWMLLVAAMLAARCGSPEAEYWPTSR